MFAKFNYTNFPIVNVDLSGIILNDEDFTNFTNNWLQLYEKQEYFQFVFDTKNAGLINIKYSIYMAFFIKMIKRKPIQYLTNSTIYVYNLYIFKLLKLIFYIEKPVAPVELILNLNNNIQKEYIDIN